MTKVDIAVVDYGMGNLRSVSKALEHVAPNQRVLVTSDDARGLREAVIAAANEKPFLGICIGLQMLFEQSEEGDVKGLSVLSGTVKRFAQNLTDESGQKLKVPHMGWSRVTQTIQHPLWVDIADGERFYYVHSYYVQPAEQALIAGMTDYPTAFTGAIAQDNLFAVQFHPEKSAQAGLQLLTNFVNWNP